MAHAYVDAVRVAVPKVVKAKPTTMAKRRPSQRRISPEAGVASKHPTNCAVTDIPLVYRAAPGAGRVKEAAGQG